MYFGSVVKLSMYKNIAQAFANFFLKPASARPLAAFRVGLSLVLLWQTFLLHDLFFKLFGPLGFVQREVSDLMYQHAFPRFNWIIDWLTLWGLSEHDALASFGVLYIIGLCCLLLGLFSHASAALVWFLHWSFTNTGFSGVYGVDMYTQIFLFYLIWAPSGAAFSLDCFLGRTSNKPSWQARLGIRVLQLHMCISYLASGIEKASGEQWWSGDVLWIALNTPGYSSIDFHWLAHVPMVAMLACWATLAIEILYCVMVWPRKTRMVWVIATCSLHVGIALFLNLAVFGILMCVPTIALFAFDSEPNMHNERWRQKLPGLSFISKRAY